MRVSTPHQSATLPAPAPTTPIGHVQGGGATSPLTGERVAVEGVVTGIQRTGSNAGFFLQDPVGDNDPESSDALYVRMGAVGNAWHEGMSIGTGARVFGQVTEKGGMTSIEVATSGAVTLSGRTTPISIAPTRLAIPPEDAAKAMYLESREAMVVALHDALVVGPTSAFGQYVAIDRSQHGARRLGASATTTGPIHVNGKLGPRPSLTVGDHIDVIRGPLGVGNNSFEILPTGNYKTLTRGAQPPRAFGDIDGDDQFTALDRTAIKARMGEPSSGPLDPADLNGDGKVSTADLNRFDTRAARASSTPALRIASLNAYNFFDTTDAPPPIDDAVLSGNEYRTKLAKLAGTIRDRLGAPELLALQEVENTAVLDDLLARPELRGLGYEYVQLPTSGRRSIHPTLLVRSSAARVVDVRQVQKQVDRGGELRLIGGESPLPLGPLYAREPLVVDLALRNTDGSDGDQITLIVNHFVSKFSPHGLPTEPVRIEQAAHLRSYVESLRASAPDREVIVLGDFNDDASSKAMRTLEGPRTSPTLVSTLTTPLVPEAERYSYIFDGRSDLVDNILVTPGLTERIQRAGVRHGNADLPQGDTWDATAARASDHDSPYIWLERSAPRPPAT